MGAMPSTQHAISQEGITGRLPFAHPVQSWWRNGQARRYTRDLALLVVAYYATAHLGYALAFSGPVAAIVWLPVGVGIAFLYLGGMGLWPGVVLGDLLVNNYSTLPVGSALGQSAGNLAEILVATLLLRRFCRRSEPLATLRDVAGVLAAIACGTLVSATVGSLASWSGGVITTHSLPYVWRTWWLGDLSGALIILPLALSWSHLPRRPWKPERALEASLTIVAVAGLSAIAVVSTRMTAALVFPALIWAALRFGPRGATLATLIAAGAAIWGAAHDLGAFGVGAIDSRLLETQLFIAIVSVSALSIAALVAEREALAESVRTSRARLVAASDEVRRRLERDLHDGAQQRLVVLSARLSDAAEQAHREHERIAPTLDAAQADVQGAIDELREFSRGVHPSLLRDLGLAKAIAGVAGRSTIPLDVMELPKPRLDDTSEATAYYVMLEAITNAQKHSRAARIRVRARLSGDSLHLEVVDDGVGGAVERDGSGLQGLRDRVEAIGGEFSVDSFAGGWTCVTADFPVTVLT